MVLAQHLARQAHTPLGQHVLLVHPTALSVMVLLVGIVLAATLGTRKRTMIIIHPPAISADQMNTGPPPPQVLTCTEHAPVATLVALLVMAQVSTPV